MPKNKRLFGLIKDIRHLRQWFVPLTNMSFPQRHVRQAKFGYIATYKDCWPRERHSEERFFLTRMGAYIWLRRKFRKVSPYWADRPKHTRSFLNCIFRAFRND